MLSRLLPVLALGALAMAAMPAGAADPARLVAEGTEFVLLRPGQPALRSMDLAGAVLKVRVGDGLRSVRIAAVRQDPDAPGSPVWLHDLEVATDDGRWLPMCQPDAAGLSLGFPMPDDAGGFRLTCTSGAEGKCVRFGYRPWERAPDGTSLSAAHRACMNMVRADYGGDDRPSTRDGTVIDVYDDWGIQTPDRNPAQAFEAGWGPDGAVCVNHVRIAENTDLTELEARYPRLRGRTGEVCTEAAARALGALVFNRSKP